MHKLLKPIFGATAIAFFAVGCQQTEQPASPATSAKTPEAASAHNDADGHSHEGDVHDDHGDAEIADAMAALSPEDRKAAEAQKFCAVSTSSLLGSMGTPVKLDVKGESVFLCCSGCKSKALKNPDETLATVAKMKAENSGEAK
ncbi:MAG: hypothetical protein H7Z17_12035 [Fuerstia sp.]|nr:hypothetical protein [Fuerstiella sp.]